MPVRLSSLTAKMFVFFKQSSLHGSLDFLARAKLLALSPRPMQIGESSPNITFIQSSRVQCLLLFSPIQLCFLLYLTVNNGFHLEWLHVPLVTFGVFYSLFRSILLSVDCLNVLTSDLSSCPAVYIYWRVYKHTFHMVLVNTSSTTWSVEIIWVLFIKMEKVLCVLRPRIILRLFLFARLTFFFFFSFFTRYGSLTICGES